MDNKKIFIAFSLAEILITLAVIGIIAILTIPTIINKYQEKSFNTSASLFEAKLAESLKIMNTQQVLAGHNSTENFINEFSKHNKIIKFCTKTNMHECFSHKIQWGESDDSIIELSDIKTSKNFGWENWNTSILGILFTNGTNALISYNPSCIQNPFSNQIITTTSSISGNSAGVNMNTNCLAVLYDTNGAKNPNIGGKDIRGINIKKLTKGCFVKIDGICLLSTPTLATPHKWNSCTAGKTNDSADKEIMKKYDISYCSTGDDYWAGAVIQCGGRSKLISESQINTLAKYLYESDNIATEGTTKNLKINSEKISSLGFNTNSFRLISNTEWNMAYSFYREFSTYQTKRNFANRTGSGYYVFCVDN